MAWMLGIAIGTLALVLIGVAIFVKEYIESRNRPVIYWDKDKNSDDFRDGVAWWVLPDMTRPADEHFGEFDISRGLYQALLSLDILYAFEKLPHEFILDTYEEGILIGSGVTDAAKILRQKAQILTQETYDWHSSEEISPERKEYRIKVEAADLQRELIEMAEFMDEGASKNYAVQLWL